MFSTVLLWAALALQASAYTVTTGAEAPQWQIDWSYDQERPDWQEPASENYENWTVVLVEIEDALKPYTSESDLMAVFVGDEVRGLASPAVVVGDTDTDATTFLLKVWGNESGSETVSVTLKYYNSQLNHIFTLTGDYSMDEEVGIDEDFIPHFIFGSAKYPEVTTIDVADMLASEGITPAKGDVVAAFVGDECRGVSTWPMDTDELTVFLREAGEDVVLKYYDAANNRIVTIDDGEPFLAGDATGDGVVDVSDYIGIANYILGNAPQHFNEQAADVNGDGVVDVSDYIGVANLILYGNVNGQ
ncbi:MAG: dockerin type I repeat-containing protein [Prevotella sp.]|nr:dockerin type I repeat-containing protein [Prevotella sp.]